MCVVGGGGGGGGEGREGGGGRIFSVYWDGGVLEFSFL